MRQVGQILTEIFATYAGRGIVAATAIKIATRLKAAQTRILIPKRGGVEGGV